jgi:GH15 family glucan-1,4-alpha-glucosidase
MALPIEDYALIGDLQTAALVGKDGSIDWLCLPDFASPACFCALLGTKKNGHWRIAPTARIRKTTRAYREGTLVLDTMFATASGTVIVTDFMPIRGEHPDIVRIVRGVKGRVQVESDFSPKFDYGRSNPWFSDLSGSLRAISGPHLLVLRSPTRQLKRPLRATMRFTVEAGETVAFVMTYGASNLPLPRAIAWRKALAFTERYWRTWIGKSKYKDIHASVGGGRKPVYKHHVDRSLMTLKALSFRPTGGIIAAPTTSLPEKLHGSRNWDYRYCWLRDATFTLLALLNAGYREEGLQWRDWLLRALAGNANQVQIMYGIRGERDIAEWELPWLDGYRKSRPVRVGNAASGQFQLDIFGEVLDAMYQGLTLAKKERRRIPPERQQTTVDLMVNLMAHLENVWNTPDQGIWEMRSAPKHYTYSKLMAWVAFDRAVRIAKLNGGQRFPVARWKKLRDRIHRDICKHGYNSRLGTFTQSYRSTAVDAALLFIPLVGFLPADDPRVARTVDAIEKQLLRHGFVERYNTQKVDDSLPGGEGVFLACSFWLVQVYQLQGRVREAHGLFQRLAALCNDVGLLSEEYDPASKRLLGNFPQAFSHIALVNAAFSLQNDLRNPKYRSRRRSLAL